MNANPFCEVHTRAMVERPASTPEQEFCGTWFQCELCTNSVLIPSPELIAANNAQGGHAADCAWAAYGSGCGCGVYAARIEAALSQRRRRSGPKPRVTFDGRTYVCKSYKVEIPNFEAIGRHASLTWLIANTYPTGYSRVTNPLAGFAGVVSVG